MFSYDSASDTLKICKVPESDVSLGLLDYQQASFNTYVSQTIYSDMDFLVQTLKENLQVSQIDAKIRVLDLHVSGKTVDVIVVCQ